MRESNSPTLTHASPLPAELQQFNTTHILMFLVNKCIKVYGYHFHNISMF